MSSKAQLNEYIKRLKKEKAVLQESNKTYKRGVIRLSNEMLILKNEL